MFVILCTASTAIFYNPDKIFISVLVPKVHTGLERWQRQDETQYKMKTPQYKNLE
jgi:hypothetical protein